MTTKCGTRGLGCYLWHEEAIYNGSATADGNAKGKGYDISVIEVFALAHRLLGNSILEIDRDVLTQKPVGSSYVINPCLSLEKLTITFILYKKLASNKYQCTAM